MTDKISSSLAAGILRLTLNDPATRNSLSDTLMSELQEALEAAASEPSVRVIVIAAEGPVFSAGHNLKELTQRRSDADRGEAYFRHIFQRCARLMMTLVHHPKPTIAEVQGLASAAGCQLVASCDLAVAAESAGFCTPGVNIGLFCSTPMVALSRNVAPKHAMEMLLTGDIVSAAEACRMGLVNKVVPTQDLRQAADAMAQRIAAKSMATLRIGKEAFYRQIDLGLAEAYAYTAETMTLNLLGRDAEEGIAAFIGKRHPSWSDQS
jgi:enoyl-CoA hydratase/carnithine racemase